MKSSGSPQKPHRRGVHFIRDVQLLGAALDTLTRTDILVLCSQFGTVTSVDMYPGHTAFVTFCKPRHANALCAVGKMEFDGKPLHRSLARNEIRLFFRRSRDAKSSQVKPSLLDPPPIPPPVTGIAPVCDVSSPAYIGFLPLSEPLDADGPLPTEIPSVASEDPVSPFLLPETKFI